jgi:tetratricopeptide (TPR) repeat protein
VTTFREAQSRASYLVSLGNIYIELANLDPQNIDNTLVQQAIDTYLRALEAGPRAGDVWKIEETIAKLYVQLGDKASALAHANAALEAAPENQQERVQQLIDQINTLP